MELGTRIPKSKTKICGVKVTLRFDQSKNMASSSSSSSTSPTIEDVLSTLREGRNLFLTGPGGVGKSYFVKKVKEAFPDNTFVTSTTGVSSFNLSGRTIHSFAGIGALKRSDDISTVLKRVRKNQANVERWKGCELLIIDEISMLGAHTLNILDQLARAFRQPDRAFGGIQVLFTGDFLQLPPIDDEFAFTSPVWETLRLHTIYLTKMYRSVDPVLTELLSRVRVSQPLPEDHVTLFGRVQAYKRWNERKEREEKEEKEDDFTILPTFLYSRRANVNDQNREELQKNPNEERCYDAKFYDIKKQVIFKPSDALRLKVGAQVMLTINLDVDAGLVNGSRGVVIGMTADDVTVRFLDGRDMVLERFEYAVEENGKVAYFVHQFPLILAYALSIHKVQGCTLDYAVMDLGYTVFENSMIYVALSRIRSLEGLFLMAYQPHRIKCHPEALAFYESL